MSNNRRPGTWGINFLASSNGQKPEDKSSESNKDDRPKAVQGKNPGINKQGYNTEFLNPAYYNPSYGSASTSVGRSLANIGRKRVQDDDDYFNDNEDDCLYQKAPDSPECDPQKEEDEEDPLDQFMQGIEVSNYYSIFIETTNILIQGATLCLIKTSDSKSCMNRTCFMVVRFLFKSRAHRYDIEKEDELESYLRFMEQNPNLGVYGDEDEIYEYDAEGNIVAHERKEIDPLPPIDHSLIAYSSFNKNFYTPHEEIVALDALRVSQLREKLGIKVRGLNPVSPVCSFAHFNLDQTLIEAIREAGYSQPTPIQAQAVPVALSGRDIIGIAKTGSGKTAAFLWPMLVHIMDQSELKQGDGPIGVVCAPTRELALQIYAEAKKLAKVYNLGVVCAYGGGNLWEQQKACEAGCEILICTPGRLIDLVKKKATNLRRVTFLVFDEADKMFNLGFGPQVRSIANHVRPDRQALLFSATFKSKIEKLAREILSEPVKIVQGSMGEANEDITQIVEVMHSQEEKWDWLCKHLVEFTSSKCFIYSYHCFTILRGQCLSLCDQETECG
ncbi:ATP-dependent RNA helicase ddx42 [Cichlidogyrus casuarinus]|uniref:RNA helicase n=1 Tax=Cichlidogyrus casuarinus TaxID=1844966 RepID=A0ABD2QAY8_9PLAT